MEPMEIKLKDCCLECEHFDLDYGKLNVYPSCGCTEREISCKHMPVCSKYSVVKRTAKEIAAELLDVYGSMKRKWFQAVGSDEEDEKRFSEEIKAYRKEIEDAES